MCSVSIAAERQEGRSILCGQRPISPERKTTGNGLIRQPNAKKARFCLSAINKKAQSEKNLLRLRIGFRAVNARAER